MLIGMPENLSPDMLYQLDRMGHGDCVALVDRNFPAASLSDQVCYSFGCGIEPVLQSLLQVMPLDYAVPQPVLLMQPPATNHNDPAVWAGYHRLLYTAGYGKDHIGYASRADFYERARGCFAIIQTAEQERFSNIILQKGIITKN